MPEECEMVYREWGFLLNGLHKKYYYWQAVVMLRRILTALIVVLARPQGVQIQTALVLMLFVLLLIFHIRAWPYKNESMNWLEFWSSPPSALRRHYCIVTVLTLGHHCITIAGASLHHHCVILMTRSIPVSYTHLTLPTILRV